MEHLLTGVNGTKDPVPAVLYLRQSMFRCRSFFDASADFPEMRL
jgi:hypothetical protein